jgi:hypothetical protein
MIQRAVYASTRLLLFGILLMICGGLPGCSGSRASQEKPSPPKNSSSASQPTEGQDDPDPEVKDFGYISDLVQREGRWQVTIKYAEMLEGDEAQKAAEEEGAVPKGEPLEGDFYIRDVDSEPGIFFVDEQTVIELAEGPEKTRTISLAEFAANYVKKSDENAAITESPYWFTLQGDRILKIEQPYLP